MRLRHLKAAIGIAALAGGLGTGAIAAETVGPVTDEIGVVKIAKGQPITIGTYYVISGPDTALGLDQQRAVAVAAKERDNMLAGHQIRFIHEDSACNEHGDCKKFVFSAYQFTSSDEDTFEPGTNPQKIYSDAWTDEKKAEGVKAMNEMMEKLKKM